VQNQPGSVNPSGFSDQAELPCSLIQRHAVIQTQAQLPGTRATLLNELQAQVAV
jgi:hypothetical protein